MNARHNGQTAALEALIEAHASELKLPTVKARFRQMAAEATREQQTPSTAAAIDQLLSGRDTSLSARAIAEEATADYAATLSLLRELEASGQVRREGSRRTVWRLITDEDRIAQRAAELERLAATSGTRQARPPGRARASP